MTQYRIKLSSFSFGDQGTDANEYRLPDDNLTGMLETNMVYPECAKLSGVQVPADAESDPKQVLGIETGQILPATHEWVAVRFTVPSGQEFWFPKCKRYTRNNTVDFTAFIYQWPSGDKWYAEINGSKMNSEKPIRLVFVEGDKDQS